MLVRLAMARLMARERPHPVFLDDALADTDPERFKAIARILRDVSDEMQIVIDMPSRPVPRPRRADEGHDRTDARRRFMISDAPTRKRNAVMPAPDHWASDQ